MGSHAKDTIDENVIDVTGASGYEQVLDAAFPVSDALIWSDTNHKTSNDKVADLFSIERIQELSKRGVTDIYLEDIEAGQPLIAELIANQDIDQFVAEYDRVADPLHVSQEEFLKSTRDTAHMILAAAEMQPPINVHFVQIKFTDEQQEHVSDVAEQMFSLEDDARTILNQLIADISKHTNLTPSDEQLLAGGHIPEYIADENAVFDMSIVQAQFRGRVPDEMLDDAVFRLKDLKNSHLDLSKHIEELRSQFRIDNDVILAERIFDTRTDNGRVVLVHGAGHGNVRDGTNGVDIDELLLQRGLTSTRVNVAYDQWGLLGSQYSQDPTELTYYPQEDRFAISDLDNGDQKILGFEGIHPAPTRMTP